MGQYHSDKCCVWLLQECQDLIHFTLDNFLTQAEGSPYECAEQLYGNTPSAEIDTMDSSTKETTEREKCVDFVHAIVAGC